MTTNLYAVTLTRGHGTIIDFESSRWLSLVSPIEGASENRNGHEGLPGVVVAELTAEQFVLEARHNNWDSGHYCLVFM